MSDSQEEVDEYLKYEVANPLDYKEFEYERSEWGMHILTSTHFTFTDLK